jgi:hypothetical protein
MPTPEEILQGLEAIANDWRWLAIAWHAYFALLALGVALGCRPSKRMAGLLLSLPLFSVSALAWLSANPFNGMLFAVFGIVLVVVSLRLPPGRIRVAPVWAVITGSALFLFGWGYPHFLETDSFVPYVFSAPTGLVPCPTLSIVIGLSIIVGSLGARAWSVVLAVAGLFYGLYGAAVLGVALDWVLLLGALAILFTVRGHRSGISADE